MKYPWSSYKRYLGNKDKSLEYEELVRIDDIIKELKTQNYQ
ncbi:MAG: hypothetical protein PHI90_03900 [Clostridia bacterium]|nr:hypothetical protein [Clostridia bacterium]MDD4047961.1 hypothetical protein [Clostridia bacterium]